jgi:hypothetical protein
MRPWPLSNDGQRELIFERRTGRLWRRSAAYPMAFCQMPCVLSEADVCMRLFAGMRTRPAVAGMVAGRRVVGRMRLNVYLWLVGASDRAWCRGRLGRGQDKCKASPPAGGLQSVASK